MTKLLDNLASDHPVAICGSTQDTTTSLTRSEIAKQLRHLSCQRIALFSSNVAEIISLLCATQLAQIDLVLLKQPLDMHPSSSIDAWRIDSEFSDGEVKRISEPRVKGQGKIIITTSGTTGTPKAAEHKLESLIGTIKYTPGLAHLRWLLTYAPASFAGIQLILTSIICRGTLLSSHNGSVQELAEIALREQPHNISATPTFWRSFLLTLGVQAKSISLKNITIGGEAVDQGLLDDLARTFPNAAITHIYASTEAGVVFSVKDMRAGFPSSWLTNGHRGTKLRISDNELQVLSPRRMLSYADAKPNHANNDNWLNTGDLVKVDIDRVYFAGRIDERINVGGTKVVPGKVESALLSLDEVSDARVFAQDNPITGQIVAAEVVLKPGREGSESKRQIVYQLKQTLDRAEVPRMIRIVEQITTNATGKKIRK